MITGSKTIVGFPLHTRYKTAKGLRIVVATEIEYIDIDAVQWTCTVVAIFPDKEECLEPYELNRFTGLEIE